MFPRKEIKAEQKKIVAGHIGNCLIVTLLLTALISALELSGSVFSLSVEFGSVFFLSFGVISYATSIFVFPVLIHGYRIYISKLTDKSHGDVRDLFSGFSDYRRVIAVSILYFIYVFLFSLLFIIPGIIAAYRYRFAFFVLMDSPNLTARQVLKVSAELTKGFKWDLFVLDLSFIGLELLCVLTLGVLNLWVMPYVYAVEMDTYRYICYLKSQTEY